MADQGKHIKYTKGYKYQIRQPFRIEIPGYVTRHIQAHVNHVGDSPELYRLYYDPQDGRFGVFVAEAFIGYAYDGPSGPAVDTPEFMRGSLCHDIMYQALRCHPEAFRDHEAARLAADQWCKNLLIEDSLAARPLEGTPFWSKERFRCFVVRKTAKIRAAYVVYALRKFGQSSADPKNRKKLLTAP